MSLIRTEQHGGELVEGERSLEGRPAPQLWLNMGFSDPAKKGAPTKTDYFGVRETDEFASERLRLFEVFGDQPREIEIMLPQTLPQALDIGYRCFLGSREGRGVLRAWGTTNFAERGVIGRDVMQAIRDDGVLEEFPIAAADDPFAKQKLRKALNSQKAEVELSMTLYFSIPKVLGYGGLAAVSSKGEHSFRNIWNTLREWYTSFDGPVVAFGLRPVLYLKKVRGRRGDYWALAIRNRETIEEMAARFSALAPLLQGTAPASLPTSVGAAGKRDPSAAVALPHGGGEEAAPPPVEEEPEDVEGEIVDEERDGRGGEPEGQQVLDVKAAPGQFKALNDVLYTLKQARKVMALVDTTSGEIVADAAALEQQAEASEVDPWVAYARAYTRHHFGLDGDQLANQLTAAQLQELIDHLSKLDIPF